MSAHLPTLLVCALLMPLTLCHAADGWWNAGWTFRTSVTRAEPWRSDGARILESDADLQTLLDRAGVDGQVAPESIRVADATTGDQLPSVVRTEYEPRTRSEQDYLAWVAPAREGEVGRYQIYFDTAERDLPRPTYRDLPPEELVANGGFEEADGDLPAGWEVTEPSIASLGSYEHTAGERSLRLHIDAETPEEVERTVAVSQKIDVADYAGQQIRFACSLFPEQGVFGTPVTCELVQYRADGSRILEYAIQPRWMTMEMAEGQLVEFAERGKLDPQTATLEVIIRLKLYANSGWDGTRLTDEEKEYTCWIDRVSLRPGERLPWPGASDGCFVEGALEGAPLNMAVDFVGQRRLAFNGASEGTLTAGKYNPDQRSVHWGPQRGTLEMFVQPHWSSSDEGAWTLFSAKAYLHRLQSQLRAVGGDDAVLEFSIADSDGQRHTVRGPAVLERDRWYHVAVTWDLPRAQLQIFLDGERIAVEGPGDEPWPSTMEALDPNLDEGRGINDNDRRTIPMQAFLGGGTNWRETGSAQAAIDEVRISDVVRYSRGFERPTSEFEVDPDTRALFHLDHERSGVHAGDDQFVQGYLACEEPPLTETASLETLRDGDIDEQMVVVAPHASQALYERNSARANLQTTRPIVEMPDPRFIDERVRTISRTVGGDEEPFELNVAGDLEPLMLWSRFARAEGAGGDTTLIPRWRANDNVVPFTFASLKATLAPDAESDAERAMQIFRYALKTTNYYDAHYCEDLGSAHRDRVSYTLIRALNIYPFDQCGPLNHTLRYLFIAGGISSNNAPGTHHQFEQAFYDGSQRLFDLSPRQYWLGRDNATIASHREVTNDPWLKIRLEGDPNAWLPGRVGSASFGSVRKSHEINVPLRPGERVSFGWHNEGRWMELTEDREPIHPAKVPPSYGNGALIWTPTADGEAAELENAKIVDGAIAPVDPRQEATLTYHVRLPYVLADAHVTGSASGEVAIAVSTDGGNTWREIRRGEGAFDVNLRDQVMNRYDYALRLAIPPRSEAEVADMQIRSVFIVSPLSLPGELELGDNRMQFVAGPVTEPIEAELAWVERYRSDLGVSLNAMGFYLMDDENHRNLYIARPGEELPVEVTLEGRPFDGTVTLEGLPDGWLAGDPQVDGATYAFALRPSGAPGQIVPFEVVLREGGAERRVRAQVMLADAALVAEAESAELSGSAQVAEDPAQSGGAQVNVGESGTLAFTANAAEAGKHALWMRMKLAEDGGTRIVLRVDGEEREVRATSMIGFTTWDSERDASTKMFAHYGEQRGHWAWWRVPEIELSAGEHTIEVAAGPQQAYDALALLPQTQEVDRAAMNLLHTWNFAPWLLPM